MQLAFLRPEPTIYFAGASSPADFRGFASAGVPVGVAWPECSPHTLRLMHQHIAAGGHLMVDSGAFSAFRQGKPEPDFAATLAGYQELAETANAPERLCLIGPDRIGDQAASLDLIRTHERALGPWSGPEWTC